MGRLACLPPKETVNLRRAFEIAISLSAIVFFSPLLILISLLIKLDSPGPALFRQVRVGQRESHFEMLKFRTMRVAAHEAHEALQSGAVSIGKSPLYKSERDERVTKIGVFLRRSSLDELPQFVNVLRGDMSLVGPRPMLPSEIAYLTPKQRRRFVVKPGMTGLAQINGRSLLSLDSYVNYDLELIDNFTLREYVRILLATIPAILSGRGAV